MKISFLGAAGEVTGSMHCLEINGQYYLLDCGLQQGRRKEAYERNRQLDKLLPVPPNRLAAVFLSHAHIDHSGALPILVKLGFNGTIYATDATRDLCEPMLADSGRLQEHDVSYVNKIRGQQGKNLFEPLYNEDDALAVMPFFQSVSYEKTFDVSPELRVTYHDAGHILGSAMIELEIKENGHWKKIIFTGDVGRHNVPILQDPWPLQPADALITEATYGDRLHEEVSEIKTKLKAVFSDAITHKSKVIIPAFSVGRPQVLAYILHQMQEAGELPALPIYIDGPLSLKATEVYREHPECYDEEIKRFLARGDDPFSFETLHYIHTPEESKALNTLSGPLVIISSSGMCEGGRILHHLKHSVADSKNIILIIGYMAANTLGRHILEQRPIIKIFGEEFPLRAKVVAINAFSAHADQQELLTLIGDDSEEFGKIFVVHSEETPAHVVAEKLQQHGHKNVVVPMTGQSFEL
jgi:metallo-beta-lactamase family protein